MHCGDSFPHVVEEEVDVGDYKDEELIECESPESKRKIRGKSKPMKIVASFLNRQTFSEVWPILKKGFHRSNHIRSEKSETWYYVCSKKGCNMRRTVYFNEDRVILSESEGEHQFHNRETDLKLAAEEEKRYKHLVYYPEIVHFRPKYVSQHPEDIYLNVVPDEEYIEEEYQHEQDIEMKASTSMEMPVGTLVENEPHSEDQVLYTIVDGEDPGKKRSFYRLLRSFDTIEEFQQAWPDLRPGYHKNRELLLESGTKKVYYICSKKGCRKRRAVEYYEKKVIVYETVEDHLHFFENTGNTLSDEVKDRIMKLYEQSIGPQKIFSILQDEYLNGQLASAPPQKTRVITDLIYRTTKKKGVKPEMINPDIIPLNDTEEQVETSNGHVEHQS